MTSTFREPPAPWHASSQSLADYAAGTADATTAWSLEAHLTSCAHCRTAVTKELDADRLARNRSVLLVRAAVREGGVVRRAAARVGVPDHLLRLVAATPSLRLSWLLSVVGVLAVTIGEAALAHRLIGSDGLRGAADQQVLLPFVIVSPLLILASVAAAFLPMFDPAYRLAVAAPLSGVRLLLVRTLAALVAAGVPVVGAGALLPGPGWVPAALLGPSFALCMLALAAATITRPVAAALGVGLGWAVAVLLATRTHSPLAVVDWHAQAASAVAVAVAAAGLFSRRPRFDVGWQR